MFQFHYLCVTAVISVSFIKETRSQVSVTPPGDNVVAGRPFTLKGRIPRHYVGLPGYMSWRRLDKPDRYVYLTESCEPSIPLRDPTEGFSGGCERVGTDYLYSLTIKNVTIDMEGSKWRLYSVFDRSEVVTLRVKVMVTSVALVSPPGRLSAGNSTTFTCTTSPSKPEACIKWYIHRQGASAREITTRQPVCNQTSTKLQPTTRTQTFTATTTDNGANLYCTATNRVTDTPVESARDYTLNVQYTPQIRCNKSQLKLFEGQHIILMCEIISKPISVITWTKDGKDVDQKYIITLSLVNQTIVQYHLYSQLDMPSAGTSDSGVLRIIATNSLGSSHQDISVDIIENPGSVSMITGEGMGVGIVVGGIIVILVVVLLWVTRRGGHISSSDDPGIVKTDRNELPKPPGEDSIPTTRDGDYENVVIPEAGPCYASLTMDAPDGATPTVHQEKPPCVYQNTSAL